MTPGQVKGYLRQLSLRKGLSAEEKVALKYAMETMDIMVQVAPVILRANKELESVSLDADSVGYVDNDEADKSKG